MAFLSYEMILDNRGLIHDDRSCNATILKFGLRNFMTINPDKRCSIFFGDASTSPVSHKHKALFKNFCNDVRQQFDLKNIVVQHQVHGANGWIIDDVNQLTHRVMYEERDGDFLITNQVNVGLGVITADCLPIIFYVPEYNVIAAAHAGWRGSVAGIGVKVVENFIKQCDFTLEQIQVYFGPAARICCYEVQEDFLINIPDNAQRFITKRDNKIFFDNSEFNKQQLIAYGIVPENINDHHNLCTICNYQFCSYRRSENKENFKTQMTLVWLR